MKIYGGKRRISDNYIEVKFTEYNEQGEVMREGIEDFSPIRLSKVPVYDIWTWDGETRNKGGHRWFNLAQRVRTTGTPAELKRAYISARERIGLPIPAAISIRRI